MKKVFFGIILVLALILTGCNFPGFENELTLDPDDIMATEIARILTGTPVDLGDPTKPVEATQDVVPTEPEHPQPEPTEPVATEEPLPTSTPTMTPEPTPTPTATVATADTDPALTLGDPDWVDQLDTAENWFTGTDSFTTFRNEDGFFKLTAQTNLYGWRLAWPVLENFYIEYTLKSPNCSGDDSYGVFFRAPRGTDGRYGGQGYLFGISCDGRYFLNRWDGRTMHFLVSRTASDSIQAGINTVNRLGVKATGADIALYINGQLVNQVRDSNYLSGKFGLFVFGSTNQNLSVWMDQVRYWNLP